MLVLRSVSCEHEKDNNYSHQKWTILKMCKTEHEMVKYKEWVVKNQ